MNIFSGKPTEKMAERESVKNQSRIEISPVPEILKTFPELIEMYSDNYPEKIAKLRIQIVSSNITLTGYWKSLADSLMDGLSYPIAYKDIFNQDRNSRSEFSIKLSKEEKELFDKQKLKSAFSGLCSHVEFYLGELRELNILNNFNIKISSLTNKYKLYNIEDDEFARSYSEMSFEDKIKFVSNLSDLYYDILLQINEAPRSKLYASPRYLHVLEESWLR
jgi:hypothetical protein